MQLYEEQINIKETVRDMKKRLQFLKQYTAGLRLYSAIYSQQGTELQVEDSLVDYLHYSKSILCANRKPTYGMKENEILVAMEKQQKDKKKAEQRDYQAYILLEGIKQLHAKEKQLLLDIYVKQLDKRIILLHQGDVVESTMHRRVRKACLHLAQILHMEILQK